MARDELDKKYKVLEEKYKQKFHALLVAEAELQSARAAVDNCRQVQSEIEFLKYKNTMGEDKVRAILIGHKEQTYQMVSESLEKVWKTWSTQAAKLQLLRADHEN